MWIYALPPPSPPPLFPPPPPLLPILSGGGVCVDIYFSLLLLLLFLLSFFLPSSWEALALTTVGTSLGTRPLAALTALMVAAVWVGHPGALLVAMLWGNNSRISINPNAWSWMQHGWARGKAAC